MVCETGILNPDNCWVSSRTDKMHGYWKDLGAHATLQNEKVVNSCDIVFLAVKPYILDDVIASIKKCESKLFISVLAGMSLDTLYNVRDATFSHILM